MSNYDTNNIFAKILRGEIPCDKVFENEHALAFRDITPQTPVHVLIIPKGAYVSSSDFCANASSEEITGLMRAVAKVEKLEGVTTDGYRLISNAGGHANQEVPHYHIHMLGGRQLEGGLVQ